VLLRAAWRWVLCSGGCGGRSKEAQRPMRASARLEARPQPIARRPFSPALPRPRAAPGLRAGWTDCLCKGALTTAAETGEVAVGSVPRAAPSPPRATISPSIARTQPPFPALAASLCAPACSRCPADRAQVEAWEQCFVAILCFVSLSPRCSTARTAQRNVERKARPSCREPAARSTTKLPSTCDLLLEPLKPPRRRRPSAWARPRRARSPRRCR